MPAAEKAKPNKTAKTTRMGKQMRTGEKGPANRQPLTQSSTSASLSLSLSSCPYLLLALSLS